MLNDIGMNIIEEFCKNNDDIIIIVWCAFTAHYTNIINNKFNIIWKKIKEIWFIDGNNDRIV